MSSSRRSPVLGRREFLKASCLVAGALAVNPLVVFAGSSPSESSPALPSLPRVLKAGALLPQSSIYPNLSNHWAAAMELYFHQAGGAGLGLQTLVPDNLGPSDSTELMVGIAGANAGISLGPVLDTVRSLFIASDAGANVLRESEKSPNIFHNTLGYWQANAAMGEWAAKNLGHKAFVASSFYESGYDTLYSFQSGFGNAGGHVAQTYVAHVPPSKASLPEMIAAIQRVQPDFTYAFFSGAQAVEFVRAYADAGLLNRIPLAGSAFMVDESLLPQIGDAAIGIYSGLSWSPTCQSPQNQAFMSAFKAATGHAADAFAVLGYDTARWIAEAVNRSCGDLTRIDRLRAAFSAVEFSGPRGDLSVDPETHTAMTPLYLRQVQSQGGKLVNQVIGELPPVRENDSCVAELRTSIRTGWTHPYLGI